jgi:hypothetical protein
VLAACGTGATDEPVASEASETIEAASPSPSSSPTPTEPATQESVVGEFVAALANRGYGLKYAVMETNDFKSGGETAPILVLVWDNNVPQAFNEYQAVRHVLDDGYDLLLPTYGIESYGLGIILKSQGTVWINGVRLRDASHVPGPNGSDYIHLGLLKTIPELEVAG